MADVVEIKNLVQKFGHQTVLNGIDLNVKQGEILGLLGPSGSGKTTMVKAVIGMSNITKGEVHVLGTKMPSLKTVTELGYMAQADSLYEDLSAYDNLIFFSALYGLKGKNARDRADQVLELVQLKDDGKKIVKNFSGGMKRRLSLAISLIHDPKILILDEPTVGIDPVLRVEFWKEFQRLKSKGVTILITTHVMDEAENCDRLALIRDGKIIALDTPMGLKEKSGTDTVEKAFLYFGSERGNK